MGRATGGGQSPGQEGGGHAGGRGRGGEEGGGWSQQVWRTAAQEASEDLAHASEKKKKKKKEKGKRKNLGIQFQGNSLFSSSKKIIKS